jgi:hypothetical protein
VDEDSKTQDPLLIASVELCTAAEAHSELLILQSFSRGIRSQSHSSSSSSGDKGRQREGSEEEAEEEGESAVYLEASEVHALRLMLLLLGVSMLGRSSGQFLAAGAIRIEDFPVIGESLILLLLLLLLHSPSLLSLLPPLLLLLV